MPNLAGAIVIAFLTASALHLSVQPAAADTKSFCAHLAAVELNIMSTMAPSFAKELAIAAIYGTKKAAGCERVTEAAQ
jgi:hypothetical protein